MESALYDLFIQAGVDVPKRLKQIEEEIKKKKKIVDEDSALTRLVNIIYYNIIYN